MVSVFLIKTKQNMETRHQVMERKQVVDHIESFIRAGETNKKQHKIGVEIEHFIVERETERYIHYFSEFGTRDILKRLKKSGWKLHDIDGYLLGASKEELDITIEPGSQIEVSIASKKNVRDLKQAYDGFLTEIQDVFNGHDYILTYAGYNPVEKIENIPLLPKKRYEYMYDHFKQTGKYAHNMMKGTAALQISIDYEDETDFNRKIKSAYWLSPIFYAAFDNVLVFEDEYNKIPALRAKIWDNCDNERCGIIEQVFGQQMFTYRDYSEIVADISPIFIPVADGDLYTGNKKMYQIIEDNPDQIQEIQHFLGMCFFDVRVKQYIEIRAIDGLSPVWSFAAASLIKNLFYRSENLNKLYHYAANTNAQSMLSLQKAIMQKGMDANLNGINLWKWLDVLLDMAISQSNGWEKEQIIWLKQRFQARMTPREMRHQVIGKYHCRCCMPLEPTWVRTFKDTVNNNHKKYLTDYYEVAQKVNASTAIYQGQPMRFVYQPMIFDEKQTEIFGSLSQILVGILKKVIYAYRTDPKVRQRFGFSKQMESLILTDPGYHCEFPVARFDIFYDFFTGDYKFCELNADGTSSMNESREISDILLKSHVLDMYKESYVFEKDELFDSWINTVISLYKEFKGDEAVQKPTIAIADFKGDGITSEFEIFKKRFIEHGYPTQICDPSELNYRDNQLWLGNRVVDIIYRRATTGRIVEEIHHAQDMIQAYQNGDVCMIGGFVSQLIHNKVLFALLHEEGLFNFTQAEKEFIEKHIPFTTFLATASHKLIMEIKANKDQYILKPFDQYAAHGIRVGQNYSYEKWGQIVDDCKEADYLIQEFYEVPKIDLCVEEAGALTFKPHRHMIGLFMYAQRFVGTYIRVGQKPIIATHGGESLTMAGIRVKKKVGINLD